jgi:hypothetical protein
VNNPNCDGAHCQSGTGEVRVLPTGGDSNAILCRSCFTHEVRYREERNRVLSNDCKFKLPAWDDLEVYSGSNLRPWARLASTKGVPCAMRQAQVFGAEEILLNALRGSFLTA